MGNVDQLIEELFPDSSGARNPPDCNAQCDQACSPDNKHDWDGSSSDDTGDGIKRDRSTPKYASQRRATSPVHHSKTAGPSGMPLIEATRATTHHFDDEDEEDIFHRRPCASSKCTDRRASCIDDTTLSLTGVCCNRNKSCVNFVEDSGSDHVADTDIPDVRMSSQHLRLFAVPFPKLPELKSVPVCTSRCYVTNEAADLRDVTEPRPTVAELLRIVQGCHDTHSTPESMMRRKGAYYVANTDLGNGAADHCGDPSSHAGGGCTWIMCLRCHYVVIRLQGAAWNDVDGAINLYLTTRNHYPDWSRFAASYPVGVREPQRHGLVLKSSPDSAAYCCQCSWLTVRTARAVIEARITEAAQYPCADGVSALFATTLPLARGERRRPPLWVCRGHPYRDV